MNERCACLIVAAGNGSRMNSAVKKQFMEIGGIPVLARTIKKFDSCQIIDSIIIVSSAEDTELCVSIAKQYCKNTAFAVVEGGKERSDSVYNGLTAIEGRFGYVMIQDGVRPFTKNDDILRIFDCVKKYGACVPAVPVKDTVKVADENGFAANTLKRDTLWAVQTPQAFRFDLIKGAYDNLTEDNKVTDDASVAEISGVKVKLVMGNYENIKITTPEDLAYAKILAERDDCFEIG
ncbi:2-C-methyl-D-erythritol 4-phosphate cytidylyltransferase [Lachnospiraceae bacterium NSJ-143]|nr:2-C-methyl-D-erythritol 4-phosphate cytidylyltransferase [Lachnospiraceae bacterium NSJ-143]